MSVLDDAIKFATDAHSGQFRKMSAVPYILHPLEVAAIIATMTDDINTMAAGVLHDTVEDCGVDPLEIKRLFGTRVLSLVMSETEEVVEENSKKETWVGRKELSLTILSHTKDREVKVMWLADKLSNMRSFVREHNRLGDKMWQMLNQKDPAMHEWYYRSIAAELDELKGYDAYNEFIGLINELFKKED